MPRRPWSERLDASPAGRLALSLLIAFLLVGIVVVNLPDSKLKDTLSAVTRPAINVAGLDQNWNVFAPNPRRESIGLEARVTFTDGRHLRWRPYAGGDLLGAYRDYRWWKWVENVRLDENRDLWGGIAAWVARTASERRGRRVRRVILIRRWREIAPPGAHPTLGPQRLYVFYTRSWPGRGA